MLYAPCPRFLASAHLFGLCILGPGYLPHMSVAIHLPPPLAFRHLSWSWLSLYSRTLIVMMTPHAPLVGGVTAA